MFLLVFLFGSQSLFTWGRQAINYDDDMKDAVKVIQQESQECSDIDALPCLLDIQTDLPKPNDPQPLYLLPETEHTWFPNKYGVLEIPHGANIELYCSSSFENIKPAENTKSSEDVAACIPENPFIIKPVCIQGKTFQWLNHKYTFSEFVCKEHIEFIVEKLNESCGGTGQIYRVGHNITESRFVETNRICYDSNILRNHYTHHRLQPGNKHFQRNVDRIEFSKAGHFLNLNMNFFYTKRNQKQQALKFLESEADIEKLFPGGGIYLARGHLSAKADAIYANQQRSSFIFHNVAPQWQSFNGGQWLKMEIEVRRFVNRQNLDVDCYTGTWGTLRITSSKDNNVTFPFYLAQDHKRNCILPVPKLFYRVIVDRKQSQYGIALIGVNNPHATIEEIKGSYIICKDISTKVPWLKWIQNTNLANGFIYACTVRDFRKAVAPILPKCLRSVVKLLK